MKLKKYSLVILSILLILLVFVSSASAADSNGTDILSIDESASTINENLALDYSPDTSGESNDTNVIENNENNLLSADNDESGNVLREGTDTFANLQTEISTALSSGNYVKLTKDTYTYAGSGSQIEIGKSCTIDGNGAVIDMAGSNIQAFSVTTSGVTIKNLTIKNANFNGNGGAIYFSSSGTVENCNFTANQASGGGAVFFRDEGTVTNCNFTNNTASKEGGAVYFDEEGTVTNCNFTANQASHWGGAVFFWDEGTVTNCNFTNNKATGSNSWGGAVYFLNTGNVTNCNFTNNTASEEGGAVYFDEEGTVTNCNFINNTANEDGGAIRMYSGTVSNCNFTANQASGGGAVYFSSKGNVTNCNFADNSASRGGAIFSNSWYSIADTCIFKRNSGENVNTVIFPPTLNVDNFTTFYGSGEKLTFDLKTNSGIPVTNGNISISVYFKNNESLVGNYSCLSGEGWTVDLPVGSYYAIFDTEYAEFKPINRTIKVIPNIKYYANVTSLTTNNKTVNITAKSNIPQNILEGKLLFILPNSTEINATYASNGTWWALHTFDDAGDYNINASYIGLDDVSINNATIRIMNVIPINTSDISIYFGDVANVIVYVPESINGQNITITVNKTSKNATVKNGEAKANFTDLPVSKHLITADYLGDDYNCANSTNATLTVSKRPTEISIENKTLNLFAEASVNTGATLTPPDAGNLTYTSSNPSVAIVENGKIKGIRQGEANITVSFAGNENYTAAENKTIAVTVSLNDASVTVNNDTLNLEVGQNFTIVATTVPEGVNVTFVQDDSGVYIVDENGVVTALKNGTGSVLVKVGGDGVYAENSTIVNVTVSKVPTEITVLNDTLVLEVSDEIDTGASLTPPDAGNLTYSISNPSVVKVEDGKIIALAEGEAIITVSFKGDNKYAEAENKTINVTVNKIPTEIAVDPDSLDLFVGDETVIVATLTPGDAGNVSFTSSDDSIVIVDNKGNIIANGKGQAIITVSFAGDNKYAESENKTVSVDVSLNDASVSVDNDTLDLKVDETYQINAAKHPDTILLDITYKSSNESVASVDENGVVTAIGEGTAIITVEVGDGEIYAENSTNVTVTVKKVNPAMNITCDEITEGENATISVTLPSDATGNVTTTVNGKTYSSEVKDGKAVITIPDLIKGDYTLPITYSGDDKYNPLTKDVNITVGGGKAIISAPELVKYYSGPERFTVNLTYAKGSPAANTPVNITINGVTYPRTTDENGTASLNINLGAGKYDVTVKADDVTEYSVVTVLSTINASDVESKSKNLVFTAAFIDGEGNPLTDGTLVTFNVKGVIYNSTVKGGKGSASVDLTLDSGRYIITSYNPVSGENASNNIAVDLKDADMILSGDEITVGENATIGVTLPDDATGNVTASVNGKSYSSKVNDGKANIIIPGLTAGNYTIPVSYSGDDKYNSASGEANITVNKADAAMAIDAPAITEGENATVTVTLASDATGSVTIGNESVPVKDGAASAVLTDLPVGTNTIPITYSGDDKYNQIETSADVVVNEKPVPAKENLTIKATADEITKGENATVIITGLENATGNVSISVNGKTYSALINNGQTTITVPGLTENVTAAINYPGDDKYNPATATVNITVNRNTVTINAENLTKFYKDSEKFTVTVTDAKGQVAPNKTVDITINGVTYKRTTDENGTASLNINLGAGEYPVSVTVDDVVVNSTVIVKSTIDASDVVKMFRNDTQYYAIFSDANGNILLNTNVSFNINGVIYNRTTDGNGTAKMNINMAAGDYIVTATNPVTGEMKSNSIKVISLIESDDLTKYYKNASQFVVRIHSADGGYVGAGEKVTFNINGVFYTRTTNATGHAKLNINLGQGNYTITSKYKNCSQSNDIKVLPILSADDLVMKYRDGSQFKAKLVDGQGKAYAGQSVQFNINGVLYNRVTGSDGVAKLNINLMSGEYIITSSFNGFNTANKITIKS